MIYDVLSSKSTGVLSNAFPVLRQAFAWIGAHAETAAMGISELKGPEMYVNVHGYDTCPVESCLWESHRHTVDLQYCIAGGELIAWTAEESLTADGPYQSVKDTQKWSGEVSWCSDIMMCSGAFAVFFPGELHRPKIYDGRNRSVRKLVVKIQADLFLS